MRVGLFAGGLLLAAAWAPLAHSQEGGTPTSALQRSDAGEWQLTCNKNTYFLKLTYAELVTAAQNRLQIIIGTVSRQGADNSAVGTRIIIAKQTQQACVLTRLGP